MSNKILVILLLVIAFSGVASFFLLQGDRESISLESGRERSADLLPNVSITDADGNHVSLHDFAGTPLVINSWATWCPFCVDEIPDFVELQREFGEDILLLAINRREPVNKAEEFLATINITPDKLIFLYDRSDSFYQRIGGFAMPETLFVNAQGEIIVHKRGFMELDEMREHTKRIIE